MTTVVILDTDFLSAFLKIHRLDLVRDFYGVEEVRIPQAVFREVSATDLIVQLSALPWAVVQLPDRDRLDRLRTEQDLEGLGQGEIEAIAVAQEYGDNAVLLTNDNQARRKAVELGVEVDNIPAFLLACRQTGFLNRDEIAETVISLEREDHYGFRREVRERLLQ